MNRPIGRKSREDLWDKVVGIFKKGSKKKERKYETFEDMPIKTREAR